MTFMLGLLTCCISLLIFLHLLLFGLFISFVITVHVWWIESIPRCLWITCSKLIPISSWKGTFSLSLYMLWYCCCCMLFDRFIGVNSVWENLLSWYFFFFVGVSPGCIGRCESNPCLNNGTCLEGYDGFKCDCRWTAFKGPICADGM